MKILNFFASLASLSPSLFYFFIVFSHLSFSPCIVPLFLSFFPQFSPLFYFSRIRNCESLSPSCGETDSLIIGPNTHQLRSIFSPHVSITAITKWHSTLPPAKIRFVPSVLSSGELAFHEKNAHSWLSLREKWELGKKPQPSCVWAPGVRFSCSLSLFLLERL